MAPPNHNASVAGLPFFTPQHTISPGTPLQDQKNKIPTLFTPLPIRSLTLRNRIIVAPMCQYSTAPSGPQIGALTPYHIATLGHYALKGAALVFIEATGVQPNGRITPNCPGLWQDEQIAGVKAVVDFCHSQGAKVGMQLAHAGRKASTCSPWVAKRAGRASLKAGSEVGGWPGGVVGPSGGAGMAWDGEGGEGGYYAPRELTGEEIGAMVRDWVSVAKRAVRAGVDVLEVHAAHGYLIHQFLSPITNCRTDGYGGGFEGRTRLLMEIVRAVRAVLPKGMPLFVRLSATEWLEETDVGRECGTWDVKSTIRVAKMLAREGVDFLDVSSGGNHPKQRITTFDSKDYQTKIAGRIRRELRAAGSDMLIGAVGLIVEAQQARGIVERADVGASGDASIEDEAQAAKRMTEPSTAGEPMADAILVARQFMREPEWVLRVAWHLGVNVAWPSQFDRVRFPKL